VLCVDFRGYQTTYRHTLPPQESVSVFNRHDSLYRFLEKATAWDPDDRFQSAEEMGDQLYGVLCEIVAEEEKDQPIPVRSTEFTVALRASTERPDWRILPRPQVSSDDPAAGYLAAITAHDPQQLIAQLSAAPEQTVEVDLQLAAAMIESGDTDEALALLAKIEAADRWEWRASWYRGLAGLAGDDQKQAQDGFMTVYRAVPGELAPKLALALACETAGDFEQAARWYEIVSRTDPSTTSASFGLARCRLAAGDRDGAIAAYQRVPDSSSGYLDAQTAHIRCLSSQNGNGQPTLRDLSEAGSLLEGLPIEAEQRERLTADLLESALQLSVTGARPLGADPRLLGYRIEERDLRVGLERTYRALARRATTRGDRIRLVDDANRTRPKTWT
jgi:serine/threonine-protein kinase PknG